MSKVTESKKTDYKYLLGYNNHKAVSERLHKILQKEYPQYSNAFLVPGYYQERITWSLPNSQIRIHNKTSYGNLMPEGKERVNEYLNGIARSFNHLAASYDYIKEYGTHFCTIPDLNNNLHLLDTSVGEIIAISNWGFVPFDRGKQYTTFAKVIPKPVVLQDVKLKVTYPSGLPVINEKFQVKKGNHLLDFATDAAGIIAYGQEKDGHLIEVYHTKEDNPYKIGVATVTNLTDTYEIVYRLLSELNIQVKNHETNAAVNHPVSINGQEYHTDEDGLINLTNLEVGSQLSINAHETIQLQKTIEKSNADIELTLPEPPPPPPPVEKEKVKLYVYNYKKEPLSGVALSLSSKSGPIETNHIEKNVYEVNKDDLPLDNKITAQIIFADEKKTKSKKCKFSHKESDTEHHLYLKIKWWLWLLLLIPLLLLLLLTFEQDLVVTTLDEIGQPIEGLGVSLEYDQKYVLNFKNFEFMESVSYAHDSITNSEGQTILTNVSSSLFDHLFYNSRKASFRFSGESKCYDLEEKSPVFHKLRGEVEFEFPSKINAVIILDEKTMQPVSGARMKITKAGKKMEAVSDAQGKIESEEISRCDVLQEVIVQHEEFLVKKENNLNVSQELDNNKNLIFLMERPKSCEEDVIEGSEKNGSITFSVPNTLSAYVVNYDFRVMKDRLVVYQGQGTNGKVIFDTGMSSGEGSQTIIPSRDCNSCRLITAQVISNGEEDNYWELSLICPE